MEQVAIIIPLYKRDLNSFEKVSINACLSVLGSYPIIFISPQSLDITSIEKEYSISSVERFEDKFFKGIEGYNSLMLNPNFYKRFLDYEYILIYQLDAYVFSDLLTQWCTKGYDYIGAPWLKKPIYNYPGISTIMYLIDQYKKIRKKPSKQSFYNKVGNGGFSLRKVKSHYQASITYKDKISYFLSKKRLHYYNEDVFWATEIPEFNYPTAKEALQFSFDKYPYYCYKLNQGKLPFGCHAWYKPKMKRFWKQFIQVPS